MMDKNKKNLVMVAIAAVVVYFVFFSSSTGSIEGKWINEDGLTIEFKDGVVNLMDYDNQGKYTIKGNEITVHINDEDFVDKFKIVDDVLYIYNDEDESYLDGYKYRRVKN